MRRSQCWASSARSWTNRHNQATLQPGNNRLEIHPMRKAILAAAIGAACAILGAASSRADIILGGQTWTSTGTTLQLQSVVPGGNQPLNIQCVICGDNQPQQDSTFGYTDFHNSGNLSDAIFFSTNVI